LPSREIGIDFRSGKSPSPIAREDRICVLDRVGGA